MTTESDNAIDKEFNALDQDDNLEGREQIIVTDKGDSSEQLFDHLKTDGQTDKGGDAFSSLSPLVNVMKFIRKSQGLKDDFDFQENVMLSPTSDATPDQKEVKQLQGD